MMKQQCHRLSALTAALVIAVCLSANQTHGQNAFAQYKRKMLPNVGRTVSVTGVIQIGKLGWFLDSGGWGIYILAVNDSDLNKANALDAFLGRRVRATGTLYHRVTSNPKSLGVAGMPEHFFFDVAEVEVVPLGPPHKGARAKH